jgi:hypothetical protein
MSLKQKELVGCLNSEDWQPDFFREKNTRLLQLMGITGRESD